MHAGDKILRELHRKRRQGREEVTEFRQEDVKILILDQIDFKMRYREEG